MRTTKTIKKTRPKFEKFLKEIHEEVKSRQNISLRWIKKLFWPSAGELSSMEKEVMINLYTGELSELDFTMRFGMDVEEITDMKEEIKEKIKDFILRQTPIDKLFYEIFKKEYITANNQN